MPTLSEIAALLNVAAPADGQRTLAGVAGLVDAGPDDISILAGDAYLPQFRSTRAAAVIVSNRVKLTPPVKPVILTVDDADLALAKVLELFAPPIPRPPAGIDSSARVSADANIDPTAVIGPNVVIGKRARVGPRSVLHAGVYIGDDVTIGGDCEFFANVVIRERITVGNRVIIHAGAVLGSDGFGYRWDGKRHAKIPQIGTVIVEDEVEIGSCVCIDRAKMGATRIGRGTKIDNLAQVAHNCQIGPHCIITGQVGLAGSVTLGAGVALGGQAAVSDHVTMGDGARGAGCSAVISDVEPKMIVSGMPAIPHRQNLREQAALRHLPDLRAQLRKLQEEVEQLKKNAGK